MKGINSYLRDVESKSKKNEKNISRSIIKEGRIPYRLNLGVNLC